jgi:hypothetical protein
MTLPSAAPTRFPQLVALLGGLVFVGSLLFFVASFVWRFDAGTRAWDPTLAARAGLIDLAFFTAFALHHSVFARVGLKTWIRRVAPPALERSLYVWASSLLFLATCWFWQPVPGIVWQVGGFAGLLMMAAQFGAAVFAVVAARGLDVLDLAGVRQVLAPAAQAPARLLDDRGPYRLVRHPIYLGWWGMVWLPPVMNGTRLVFAATSCAYLLLAIPFEERDLRQTFGAAYDQYARRTRWRVLPFIY